jgi:glycosyltransferase involved in cell wall biosynthesis
MHTRKVLQNINYLITVSGDLRKKSIMMGASPENVRSVVNGCDLSVFRPMDRIEARRKLDIYPAAEAVVYIGRMDVKKGLRELVKATALLHLNRPDLHVYLVGEGPDKPVIKRAIDANNSSNYMHLMPACAFDDVAHWMAAANVVTLPSYMEGCPNVVLESLASGRPLVATSVGGIPEILNNECGRLVPPHDVHALAQALASVLDQAWDAQAISSHGSRSWDTVAAELLEIFESVVADAMRKPTG